MNLDRIDKEIIPILIKDARTPFRYIARKLSVSPDTISNHFEKLKKERIIIGSTVVLNPKKIGYSSIVRFGFKVKPTYSSKILSEIIKIPSIIIATKLMGDYDLFAIGLIKDFNHLYKLRKKFVNITNVEKVDISLWANTMSLKPEYFLI